jgi:hypothetical protein
MKQTMKQSFAAKRQAMAMCGTALLGALAGVLIVAFGSVISSSPYAVAATILIASVVGGFLGRLSGTVIGGLTGVLLTAFGSVTCSTLAGALAAVGGCALLAVLIDSHIERRVRRPPSPSWYQPEEIDPGFGSDTASATAEFQTKWRVVSDRAPSLTPRGSSWHDRFMARGRH